MSEHDSMPMDGGDMAEMAMTDEEFQALCREVLGDYPNVEDTATLERSRSPPQDRGLGDGEAWLDPNLTSHVLLGNGEEIPFAEFQERRQGEFRDIRNGILAFHASQSNSIGNDVAGPTPSQNGQENFAVPNDQYQRTALSLPQGHYAYGIRPFYGFKPSPTTQHNHVPQAAPSPSNLYQISAHNSIEGSFDQDRQYLPNEQISATPDVARSDLQNGSIDPGAAQHQQRESSTYGGHLPASAPPQMNHFPAYATDQNPLDQALSGYPPLDEDLFGLWNANANNVFSTPFPTNITDASPSFSPPTHQPPFSPPTQTTSKSRSKSATPSHGPKLKGKCIGIKNDATGELCNKNFELDKSNCADRCHRCCEKWQRKTAPNAHFVLSPDVPTIAEARNLIYPTVPLNEKLSGSVREAMEAQHRENEYIQRFLDAINVPQGPEAGKYLSEQQHTLNGNSLLKPSYSPPLITARLRALFSELLTFHLAHQPHFYPVGGDNTGYSPNFSLPFGERVELICGLLERNKRIVMDVIEGRGVQGIVGNPVDYERRKVSNKDCNDKKNVIYGVGKRRREEEGDDGGVPAAAASSGSGPAKRTRRATKKQQQVVVEDDGDEEFVEQSEVEVEEQGYGSGRANTFGWINGRRGGRRS